MPYNRAGMLKCRLSLCRREQKWGREKWFIGQTHLHRGILTSPFISVVLFLHGMDLNFLCLVIPQLSANSCWNSSEEYSIPFCLSMYRMMPAVAGLLMVVQKGCVVLMTHESARGFRGNFFFNLLRKKHYFGKLFILLKLQSSALKHGELM